MAIRNIYVRNDDEVFWDWAEEQAAAQGVKLSRWLAVLIRNHKMELGAKMKDPDPSTVEDLIASVSDDLDRLRTLVTESSP